jgi:hypothetical protein
MPSNLSNLHPPLALGDKLVQVGALDWAGLKALVESIVRADLPLPNLAAGGVRDWLDAFQRELDAAGDDPRQIAQAHGRARWQLYRVLLDLLVHNLPTLWHWFLRHPPMVTALVQGATNLGVDELERLTAGQFLRVARAAWEALVADGFFQEAAGFFAGLVGLKPHETSAPTDSSAPASTAASASASRSGSPPPPAGA